MKNCRGIMLLLVCLTSGLWANAQTPVLYPTNWWVNLQWNEVQILVHGTGDNFNTQDVSVNYPGIVLQRVTRLENPHYYALDVLITPAAKPGNVLINFSRSKKTTTAIWPLLARQGKAGTSFAQGVNSSDLIYLLMPDRFSNGDNSNDKIAGMLDQSLNRDSMFLRHGGDLQGIINHLDYLQNLGVTALWLTPVWKNDMPNRTEHGYAATDHYAIDPRFGTIETYKQLSDALHKRGMKLVQDAVYNHVGLQHITVQDKPTRDWLHEWPNFTRTSYKDQVLFDPHGSRTEKDVLQNGWFTPEMPDLNQNNPYVANFLIQHALWTVETFGVDGWRIDTYFYNDLDFMNRCNMALYTEYSNISLFGETWVNGVANQSFFCENNINHTFKSNLQGTTDFQQLFSGIQPALTEKFGWNEGVNKMYNTTAQDFLYKDPMREVLFLDNHDLSRFFSVLNEDIDKYKMAFTWLLTFRGIPQMYYGSEILMKGFANPDGLVRSDFMGGWPVDTQNKFTPAGRTSQENDMVDYIKTLANFRKTSAALTTGKLMQYLPAEGLYVYFRYTANETIACVMNTADKPLQVDLEKNYRERTGGFLKAINVLTGAVQQMQFTIPAQKMLVLQLR